MGELQCFRFYFCFMICTMQEEYQRIAPMKKKLSLKKKCVICEGGSSWFLMFSSYYLFCSTLNFFCIIHVRGVKIN